jgi:Lar family restriction alleviation protein
MDTPTLLPCPFCGATDDDLSCDVDEYQRAYVCCDNCDTEGPVINSSEIGSHAAIEQAIAAWNQRSAWQPIETAPRDESKVLVWDGGKRYVAYFWGDSWWSHGDDGCDFFVYPTHWQPLLSPPPITPSV